MTKNYQVRIGIEIHLELNTKTKMFSGSPVDFAAEPNTLINEIDLGYPGTLPTVNQAAVEKAIQLAKALEMQLADQLKFDRKNYFYPDLPKGYQITQQFEPIATKGILHLGNEKKVRITRIHLEEDTARSHHQGELTLLDYNRAGVPLIEIVSEPDLSSAQEAHEYVNLIRLIAQTLNISDAKMEEGSLRADINISLNKPQSDGYGTKVEIKNLNSLQNILKAVEFETQVQTKTLDSGQKVVQATKRFDEASGQTVTMREKTAAIDYKYFAEPNIPPIKLDRAWVEQIKIAELPWQKRSRYQKLGVEPQYIEQLVSSPDKALYFDAVNFNNHQQGARLFFSHLMALANYQNRGLANLKIKPTEFGELVKLVSQGDLPIAQLKPTLIKLDQGQTTFDQVVKESRAREKLDQGQISAIIKKTVLANREFIGKNSDKPDKVANFLVGQIMRETRGQADAKMLSELVRLELKTNVQKK
ncbi:Asp-tRNA(Asn)/Glu-tRNA(Gln) amidotransferase subunit GatB [Mycoplasma sp. ATU-Cv-703]|uniref:Asp-tRNA(Asn)/Glu-tRNA(Gln) amidotransferase subunit GatB n=1 Tax=Mycoplasma sp. ATU-Cv-703 TaxID=2498595 RepID=UPI0013749C61